MALSDWLWLVRLIMEILKLIAQLPQEELEAIASLRGHIDLGEPAARRTARRKPPKTDTQVT